MKTVYISSDIPSLYTVSTQMEIESNPVKCIFKNTNLSFIIFPYCTNFQSYRSDCNIGTYYTWYTYYEVEYLHNSKLKILYFPNIKKLTGEMIRFNKIYEERQLKEMKLELLYLEYINQKL
jgi:hypothetical protein